MAVNGESDSGYSRRTVLGLVGGTTGLAMGSASVAGQLSKDSVKQLGNPSSLAGARRSSDIVPQTREYVQQAKLTADDGDSRDTFAPAAISADGTTAIIGAVQDDDPNGPNAGSAYVFDRNDGSWTQTAKLAADDGDSEDGFGYSQALSDDGTTAVIGARDDDDPNGSSAGSAYVFDRSGEEWIQETKLTPDDGESGDQFGIRVKLSADGTTAIVGAWQDEHSGDSQAGAAYVFDRDDEGWAQTAKLTADDSSSADQFGFSLGMSRDGTTAVIGAIQDGNPNGDTAGSAYVFSRTNGGWTQQTKLTAADGDSGDAFGQSVAMSADGTTAVVSAIRDDDPNGTRSGSAYVFDRRDGEWTQQTKLAPDDGDRTDQFGFRVGLSGDGATTVIGAPRDEDPNGGAAGSAYVFSRSDGGWTQQAKLSANDGNLNDFFGQGLAISADGTTTVIGATGEEDPNGEFAGAAYVFVEGESASATTTAVGTEETTTTTNPATTEATTSTESVEGATEATTSTESVEGATEATTTTESVEDGSGGSTPGFGVGGLLAALGGWGYLRWHDGDDDATQ